MRFYLKEGAASMNCSYAFKIFLVFIFAVSTEVFGGDRPVVLFDQGHGQRFVIEKDEDLQLSGLAELFRGQDCEVRSSDGKIAGADLAGVDILVSSGLFVPYDEEELQAIQDFLERGGALSVMVHVAPTYANLFNMLGVAASNGVLNETENIIEANPLDFRVKNLSPHPLADGLEEFNLYGGWALMNTSENAMAIAYTSRQSWIDNNRDRRRTPDEPLHVFGVIVAGMKGKGRFVVFGDDAIFQNRFLTDNNQTLAVNLVKWLKGRE